MLSCRCGGRGAILSGLFSLEKGQQLRVLCGGMSARGLHGNSGGGGGTYVIVEDEDEPLIVAGGGGGTRCAIFVSVVLWILHGRPVMGVSGHGRDGSAVPQLIILGARCSWAGFGGA